MYGYTASDEDDRIVKLVGEAMVQFSEMVRTNAFLVDVFPMREFHHRLVIIIFDKNICHSPVCTRLATWSRVEAKGAQISEDFIGYSKFAI